MLFLYKKPAGQSSVIVSKSQVVRKREKKSLVKIPIGLLQIESFQTKLKY